MGNGAMIGAGILLIILGVLFISGILQILLTVIGVASVGLGIIVGVIGLVGMIRGGDSY